LYSIVFLAISSFVVCLILTPLVRTWFRRQGLLDQPNEKRKLHASPIPRVGGIAIALSYLVSLALLLVSPLKAGQVLNLHFFWYTMPALGVIFTTGLLDDLRGLSPWQKLIGQVGAAGLAYWAGIRVSGVAGFPTHGWWSLPLTILWLVACANAFNLIDGVDGLATGVGLFATLTTFLAALLQNNIPLALATVPLAGALLAFLRYNFNPASIFLGDGGSLSIGFLLGCYGIIWSQKSATIIGMTAPLMVLAVPLLDTSLAVVRRFMRHQPIFTADRNHIHHRLLDRGLSPRRVALVLYGVCGLGACFSLLVSVAQNQFSGLIILVFCAATWIGIQHLGYGEFGTARRLVLTGTFRHILNTQLYMIDVEKKLVAALTGEDCWSVIRDVGRDYGFAQVRMQLAGALYQDCNDDTTAARRWSVRIPLSDWEYVNFTHHSQSMQHLIAMNSLVDILHRVLATRVQKFPPAVAVSTAGEVVPSNDRVSALAQSA